MFVSGIPGENFQIDPGGLKHKFLPTFFTLKIFSIYLKIVLNTSEKILALIIAMILPKMFANHPLFQWTLYRYNFQCLIMHDCQQNSSNIQQRPTGIFEKYHPGGAPETENFLHLANN